MITVNRAKGFVDWLNSLTVKEQLKVESRIEKIENLGHFGDVKDLKDGVAELRWKNGWRAYFIKEASRTILLLLGGDKNGQKQDIKKAKILARRYANN